MVSTRERPDDFDILSATWIMSCNDERSVMTYRGIAYRTGCDIDKAKAVVRDRSELFRPGVPSSRLQDWKNKLKQGQQLPSWLQEIEPQKREKIIDNLDKDDVFRNQFRAEQDARQCGLEVIDWGLQHIERLRKADSDAREERVRRWTTVVIPILSLLVAALSTIAVPYMQYQKQMANSMYQATIVSKQTNYASLMSSLFSVYDAAVDSDASRMDSLWMR